MRSMRDPLDRSCPIKCQLDGRANKRILQNVHDLAIWTLDRAPGSSNPLSTLFREQTPVWKTRRTSLRWTDEEGDERGEREREREEANAPRLLHR